MRTAFKAAYSTCHKPALDAGGDPHIVGAHENRTLSAGIHRSQPVA